MSYMVNRPDDGDGNGSGGDGTSSNSGRWSAFAVVVGLAGAICLLVGWRTRACHVGFREGVNGLTTWCDPYNTPLFISGVVLVAVASLVLRVVGKTRPQHQSESNG